MKKLFFILLAVISFASTEAFAQEVRGVETKVVSNRDSEGDEYQSFAFTNMNSIAVCVEVELCRHTPKFRAGVLDEDKGVVDRKSFVLQPNETYMWRKFYNNMWSARIDEYYVTYKAFKLQ